MTKKKATSPQAEADNFLADLCFFKQEELSAELESMVNVLDILSFEGQPFEILCLKRCIRDIAFVFACDYKKRALESEHGQKENPNP